ncbi:hypothetical protein BH09ACT1_BH09ACT1_07330 [soil metagenome]
MTLRRLPLLVVALLVIIAPTVASAATVGTVTSALFSATADVTVPANVGTVTSVALASSGTPAIVTGATITVTTADPSRLAGQSATLDLLDSTGAIAASANGIVANEVRGATTATFTLSVTGSPLLSRFVSWSVFVAGSQLLRPSTVTTAAVTTGSGALPAVTDWKSVLAPTASPGTGVTAVALTTSSTVSQCVTFSLRGTTTTPTAWGLQIDYSQPPYYGVVPTVDSHARVVSTNGGMLTLAGTANGNTGWEEWGNNSLLTTATAFTFSICQYNAGIAPNRPEAYSVGAQFNGTWTTQRACVSRVVTGNGLYPFYFGWSVSLDMTAAIASLRATDAGAPRALVYQSNVLTPANFAANQTSYTVTNSRDAAISGTQSQTVTLCLSQY